MSDIPSGFTPSNSRLPLTYPPEEGPLKVVTVLEGLPEMPPFNSVKRSGGITARDESTPYI